MALLTLQCLFEIIALPARSEVPILDQCRGPMRIETPDGVGDSVLGAVTRNRVAVGFVTDDRDVSIWLVRSLESDFGQNQWIFFGDEPPVLRPVLVPWRFGFHGIRMRNVADALGVDRILRDGFEIVSEIKSGDEWHRGAAVFPDGGNQLFHELFPVRPGTVAQFSTQRRFVVELE